MKKIVVILIFIMFWINSFSQYERKYIRSGNKNYVKQEYNNSEVEYQKALLEDSISLAANYNLSNSYYKQNKYELAEQKLIQSLDLANENKEKSEIYYNLANVNLMQAQELLKQGNAEEVIKKMNESIDAYKNALRNNPSDNDAKFNMQIAKEVLKQLEEQQKQQQDQNQDNQDQQQKDDKENKNQGDQENKDRDQGQNKDSDNDGIPDSKEKNEDDSGKQQNPDTDKDGKKDFEDTDSDNDGIPDSYEAGDNPEKPRDTDNDGTPDYRDTDSDNDGTPDSKDPDAIPKAMNISDEDAKRLLQYMQEKEKETLKKANLKKIEGKKVKTDKDW